MLGLVKDIEDTGGVRMMFPECSVVTSVVRVKRCSVVLGERLASGSGWGRVYTWRFCGVFKGVRWFHVRVSEHP